MRNFLLKFKHSNGSTVWFTVYASRAYLHSIAKEIEKRTSFTFLNDSTELG